MVVNAVLCLSYVMMDAGVPFQMQIEMVSDLRIIFSYDQEQFVSSNLNVNFECRNQQLCASRSLLHYWLRYENENHRGKRNLDSESANQLIIRWVINSNSFFVRDNLIKRRFRKDEKTLIKAKPTASSYNSFAPAVFSLHLYVSVVIFPEAKDNFSKQAEGS